MWEKKTFKKNIQVKKEHLWKALTDVTTWKHWNPGLQDISLQGEFTTGSSYEIKMSHAPNVKMKIEKVERDQYFVDVLSLPGAKLHRKFEMMEHDGNLDICVTLTLTGMSSLMWKNMVAEKLLGKIPKMLDMLETYLQQEQVVTK